MKTFIIGSKEENQRVEKYLLKILGNANKSFIYKMLRKKNIKLNDRRIKGNEVLKLGDRIDIYFSDSTFDSFKTKTTGYENHTSFALDIIYEDSNVLVCNKPVGLLSQPDGEGESLIHQIEGYLNATSSFKPGICNRLDRNTSGIIIAGKSVRALQAINEAIAKRRVDKTYLTIVKGKIEEKAIIEGYLIKDEVRNMVALSKNSLRGGFIKTIYKPLGGNGEYTFLEVQIITGKSHQIRAHLSSIGHPIIGDSKYGDQYVNRIMSKKYQLKYQLLHGHKLKIIEIEDPFGYLKNKEFIAPIPSEFHKIFKNLFGYEMKGQ